MMMAKWTAGAAAGKPTRLPDQERQRRQSARTDIQRHFNCRDWATAPDQALDVFTRYLRRIGGLNHG